MHCFYHQDREAVGGCKSCGKGLCPECAVDLGKGLACRERCEADVQAVIALVDRSIKLSPTTSQLIESGHGMRSSAATFNLVLGVIFIAWGFQDTEHLSFITILGVCFVAFGGYGFLQARRLAKERQQP